MIKRFRLFLCKKLGWHSYNYFDGFDGCSAKATCKICGYKGLVDSQGNLF
jgi:hypothetical protein